MSLAVDIRHTQGVFTLQTAFESSGRLTALFGPSGSGKTTLINILGGLIRPSEGRIEVDGHVLVDSKARIFVPPHKRRIGYVFQDARLFPHLSVSQNLRYGRFFTPAGERYAEFQSVVDLLGIGHLLDRRPARLSGGEKQRVAIGRALIASPKLILMDEPLASLDESRKAEIMPYIERLRDETKIPIVYVSHSMSEVARLATDVVALSAGKVAAHGPVREVLARPDLATDDDLPGASSLIELRMVAVDDGFGLSMLRSGAGDEWRLPKISAEPGARLKARIRARDVMIATERPAGVSALNVLPVKVTGVSVEDNAQALVSLSLGDDTVHALLTRRSVEILGLAGGREVFAIVKAVTFDAPGTAAGA